MKIQQFQGGLATRLEPQLLQTNQGTEYENIDNSVGVLAPVKGTSPSGISVAQYHEFFNAKQEWVSSSQLTDYLEYNRRMYSTNRSTKPQVYDGTTTRNLGIDVPSVITGTPFRDIEHSLTELTLTAAAAGDLPLEATYYKVVPRSVNTGPRLGDVTTIVVPTTGDSQLVLDEQGLEITIVRKSPSATTRNVVLTDQFITGANSGTCEYYRLYKGKYLFVGVLTTNTFGSTTIDDNVYDISANAELADDDFLNLNGTYQYVLTYYNSAQGVESGPSPVSEEFVFNGSELLVSMPVSSDPQVDKKRLYRVGGSATAFSLVFEVDNATTVANDNIKDADLGALLPSSIAAPAPEGLSFLTEAYAMLFGAVGSKLRFTPIGDPDSWPELYFLQFDQDITGIAAVANGIIVFSKFQSYLVTGTGPNALAQQLLTSDQGCLKFESVSIVGGTAMWISTDGLCASSGGQVRVISKDALGKFSLDAVDSIVYDEVYYVLDSGGKILALDFAYGGIYKNFDLDVGSLASANDVLYGIRGGQLQSFFSNTDPTTLSYTSPRFIEGSVTEPKSYKKVYFYHEGDIIITILINNVVVVTESLTGTDSSSVSIPQENQRGYFIQFKVQGTGTLHEIEYVIGVTNSAK